MTKDGAVARANTRATTTTHRKPAPPASGAGPAACGGTAPTLGPQAAQVTIAGIEEEGRKDGEGLDGFRV